MPQNTRAPHRPRPPRCAAESPDAIAHHAAQHLARVEPRLGAIIQRIGVYRPTLEPNPFRCLAASITQQQVSMSAAAAVFTRLRKACPQGRLTPNGVLTLDVPALRAAGLSRQKAAYMHDLADAFASGRLSGAKLRRMSDDEVIASATEVHGIGRWTAEMLLMFCLCRPDVWPVDDLGLRRAVDRFVGTRKPLSPDAVRRLAEPWRPYRTYAAWYLWRSLEGDKQPGVAVKPKA